MMRWTVAALCCALAIGARPVRAQEVAMDAGRLAHALDRLSGTARVLYIAAHPDDENTRLLAYLANARHVGATYLSMTRGGGGQNLIGREQDSLLDVLRTQELLAARRLDAARQRFTRMRDFGYSKSAQETLAIWGHDDALGDVVLAIRRVRPDVVITRFDELPPNHGHHTASAILAREAFVAAADPKRFTEQLTGGVTVWQATRLVHNWPMWRDQPPPEGALALDVGSFDARLGLSYGELAARSRSQHKSQGFGAAGERGPLLERFVHVAGTPAKTDLLDGVELTWARYGAPGAAVAAALKTARSQLHRDFPERALSGLADAWKALAALPAGDPRVRDAKLETTRLMAAASGLFVRANAVRPACAPGSVVPGKLELVLRRPVQLRLSQVILPDGTTVPLTLGAAGAQAAGTPADHAIQPASATRVDAPTVSSLSPGRPVSGQTSATRASGAPSVPPSAAGGAGQTSGGVVGGVQWRAAAAPGEGAPSTTDGSDPALLAPHEKREVSIQLRCPASAPISAPYWLAAPPLTGHFVLADPALADDPEGAPPLMAAVEVNLAGVELRLPVPFVFNWLDRVQGERERRVLVAPPATVTPARDAIMFVNGHTAHIGVRVRAAIDAVDGRVFLRLPAGYRAEPATHQVRLARAGDEVTVDFVVNPPSGGRASSSAPAAVSGRIAAERGAGAEGGAQPGSIGEGRAAQATAADTAPAARGASAVGPGALASGAPPSGASARGAGAAVSGVAASGPVAGAGDPRASGVGPAATSAGPAAQAAANVSLARLFAEPVLEVAGRDFSFREDVIDYPHVPLQTVLQPAKIRLSPVALQRPRGLIGYVEGSGDTIAADLSHVGADVELLSDATLLEGNLARFSAIVVGVRAYNTRDVLPRVHDRLTRYMEQGGTLIVQYVTRSTISPLDAPVGPYPLDVGRGRVTDETAAMHILDPADRVLRVPNKIGADDFAGWVQERGLYFGEKWDERYKPVFEVADPSEPPQRGSLLVARVGKGRYVYTGLAFFRQLPAGVPGAYRLFVNLLARAQDVAP
jgi:LmbE family N-acetylglucosaminyl deacetylase